LKEFNGRTIKLSEYRTAREMAYMWSDVFKEIKDIWYAGVSDRKPDLIVWNKELDGWICIEIELTPKSVKRMRIILRSLHALGDYAKGFKQVKIYANEKTIVYKKWSNVLNFVDENDRPSDLHLLKLHELLN
jgi:hypothetical protein